VSVLKILGRKLGSEIGTIHPKLARQLEQNLTEFVAEFEVLVSEQLEKITKIWNGDG